MMHVGDIMSTVGVFSTVGESFVISVPHDTEHAHGTQITKDGIPHGTEHPHGTQDIPLHAS